MKAPFIFHLSHLDTVGGVEYLLCDFLKEQNSPSPTHCLWIGNNALHPLFKKALSPYPQFYEKYLWRLKLPKALRHWNQQRIFYKYSPSLLLYWNQLPFAKHPPSKSKAAKEIFYDHGASWYLDPQSKEGKTLKRMQGLLACSKASRRMMQLKWPDLSSPIHLIPNPLRPGLVSLSKEGKTLCPKRPLQLGCSGRLLPLKGFIICFHLIKELLKEGLEVQLSIAGIGKDQQALQQTSSALGISSRVHFCSYVEDMTTFLDSLDIFLCPSFKESFGLVSLEAQARGLPVIVNGVDGLLETVEEGKTGFAIPPTLSAESFACKSWKPYGLPSYVYHPLSDRLAPPLAPCPRKMAEKILHLAAQPALYEKMSKAAKKWADKHFCFSDYQKHLQTLLNTYLKDSKPGDIEHEINN